MRSSRSFHDERGQGLVLIAIALVVLIGAVALAVDWGYGLTQRRVMVTSAEGAALAAGRSLARSAVWTDTGDLMFSVTQEQLACEADRFAASNRSFSPSGSTYSVTVEYGNAADPISWTTSATSPCPASTGTPVAADTRRVRVVAEVTYPSLLASLLGQPTVVASGSARTRLIGTTYADGPVWPMVRHYDVDDIGGQSCGDPCDPTSIQPVVFWSTQGNEPNMVYGSFKGQVDLSRMSSRDPGSTSLITQWDRSGSLQATPPTTPLPDTSGNCPGGWWDTAGGEDPQSSNKQCSIPNWFRYLFRGQLSLDSVWSSPPSAEPPSPIGARPAVCPTPAWIGAPSCDDPAVGDWVETASGNIGQNNSALMRELVSERGSRTVFSDMQVPDAPRGRTYGKAYTVAIYLWDCGETYQANDPAGQRWEIVPGTGGDCSQVEQTGDSPTPDRVHVFTVVPFTFYEGLIDSSTIRGFWGGAFTTSDRCPTGDCEMNPLSNSAILEPDE